MAESSSSEYDVASETSGVSQSELFDFYSDEELDYQINVDLGAQPYMFEPELDPDELPANLNADGGANEAVGVNEAMDAERLQNRNWCECGRCQIMETVRECCCCREIDIIQQKLEEPVYSCITDHPGFDGVCLNIWGLEVAYLTYRQTYGNLQVNGPNHEKYRYIAYRQFVRWCWGYLGRRVRVVIPACVVSAIRSAFQSETYKGFKLPDLN